jgi:hypothetical protein
MVGRKTKRDDKIYVHHGNILSDNYTQIESIQDISKNFLRDMNIFIPSHFLC